MKTNLLFTLAALLAGSAFAADAAKDEVTKAAKALGDKANYSWKTTVTVPADAQFRPGPTEGKTEKGGVTYVTTTFGENTSHAVIKGEKAAVTNRDGEWQAISEVENAEGPGRFRAAMVRNMQTPAVQAAELVSQAKELKKEGEVYSGPLTEEGAKQLMSFRRRAGGQGPTVKSAAGFVRFWVKDGELSKYEYKVDGSMEFNGNEVDVQRTTTVEVKDVGTTKIEVPEEAKKKLS